jgi:serine/threonine protein kinase/Flp pilus assembly protein TadD
MAFDSQRAKSLFLAAADRPVDERAAFLDEACADEPELRRRVEQLLEAHDRPDSLPEAPPEVGRTADGGAEGPGTVIGPYKLLQQIGEGGMGTVYMAEQAYPVQRKVALKIIKAGMDSRQVVARFEAERQALALMDHPHIAKVFDAGTTAAARPYFVMELVKGLPITKYCDERRLTPRLRLELFIPVCQAVQHAHQKGIIHRDLKPSNVLVALYDGRPVPKVIDFGVAKATGLKLTERTLYTDFGAIVGTLEYMSPEQAELNQLDIDTRSDIYSLGVLLYELLTGTTPLDRKRLQQAAILDVLRIIREEEPPRPSTRLTTTEELPSIAANRGLEPKRLSGLVRGDLDWIVMKALEKDRNRRYETANGLAMDLQRYLADEPVLACSPSPWYRLRKYARRNRGRLTAAGVLGLALFVGVGGIGWGIRDRAARQARDASDMERSLERAELHLQQGNRADARAGLDQAERIASEAPPDPDRSARLDALRQRLDAAEHDQQFVAGYEKVRLRVESQVDVLKSRFTREAGFPEVRELFRQYGIVFIETPPDQAATLIQSRPGRVRDQLVAALYSCEHRVPKDDARTLAWLGVLLEAADTNSWRVNTRKVIAAQDWKAVEQLLRAVDATRQPPALLLQLADALPAEQKVARLDFMRKIQGAYPADLWANHELAWELIATGRQGEAIRYLTAALALRPDSPGIYLNRGSCLLEAKELDAAVADYERCLALAPNYFTAWASLCEARSLQGRLQEWLAAANRAVNMCPDRAEAWSDRALAYVKLNEPEKAIADCNRAIALNEKLAAAWANRGSAYRVLGQYERAIADCTKAIELDKKLASAWADRGNSHLQRGEFDKALADCNRSIDLDPTVAFTWYSRGAVHSSLGDYEKALADCRKAVELAPGNPWTHGNLGMFS